MNSMVEENIEGNRVVKAFVRESYETEKFDERNDDYMQRNMAQAYNSRKYMPWLDGLGFSLQLITLGFGGFLVIKGYMTLGNLVAFNSYLWMLDSPIRQSGWLTNDWQRFNAACIKIRKLLTAESRIREKPEFAGKATQSTTRVGTQGTQGAQAADKSARIAGTIDFQHVDFAFPDDLGTLCSATSTSTFPQARNSESSAKPAPANRLSSTLSPVSTTQPPVVCSSTASTRATGARHVAIASLHRRAGYVPVFRYDRQQHQLWRGRPKQPT